MTNIYLASFWLLVIMAAHRAWRAVRGFRLPRGFRYWLFIAVVLGLALVLGSCAGRPAPARAAGASCPLTGAGPYVSCVRAPDSAAPNVGQQITDGAGREPGTPWLVTDHYGAPMAWVNLYGLFSGGDGGKTVGGLLCVTYGVVSYTACLTPAGTLQLTPTGPHGATGPTVTLTARDIRFLHRLEAARR